MNEPLPQCGTKHQRIIEAFEEIQDKNALAWAVLDTKSEAAVVHAIALSANRLAKARVAHVEYPPRLDLVFVDGEVPVAAYEAKAANTTNFQEKRINRNDWYLGPCIDDDLVKLYGLTLKYPSLACRAALFFVYEVSDSSCFLKHRGHPLVSKDRVTDVLRTTVRLGVMNQPRSIDCGTADGVHVDLHMFLFDLRPETDAGGSSALGAYAK